MIRIADTCWINKLLILDIEILRGIINVTIRRNNYKVSPEYIETFCENVGIPFTELKGYLNDRP